MNAGLIDMSDYCEDEDPATLIERALRRHLNVKNTGDLELSFVLTVQEGLYYLLVHVEHGLYVDFSQGARALDAIHPQLGPSLLHYLSMVTPLTPAFTPQGCRQFIEWLHWEGWEDAENLLEMARHDLAYAREVEENSLGDVEVAAYADEHYFTPNRVNAQLEPRYQKPDVLSLEELADLCRRHGLANAGKVCALLQELAELTKRLPRFDGGYFERSDGSHPFGAVVTVRPQGVEDDLVSEILREYDESVWQSGEYDPSYVLAFEPEDPGSLLMLKDALHACRGILESTRTLFTTLEVISCLFL
jgi:PRTRC genetic system protein F